MTGRIAVYATFLALLAGPALAAGHSLPIYPLDEVRPGLACEARTVFQGSQVESFRLEVLGVLHQGKAAGDLILARALEPRVKHTGIVAGMSGSPVYANDGRLLGAIAYAWSFSKDPVCGITPIAEMLEVWDVAPQAVSGDFEGGALPAPEPSSSSATLPRLRTPVAAAGLAPEVVALLQPWARDNGLLLTPGGSVASATAAGSPGKKATTSGKPALAPGDAVAVDLLRGDATLSAIGTVTAVDGDRVLAFGHPFFLSGPVRLPMSRAEITAVLPSLENSFKIGTSGETVGTLTEDRRAAVAGRLGEAPAMLPITVRVRAPGVAEQSYHYEAARQRSLAPLLVSAATVNSALARGALPAESTWRWKLSARLRQAGTTRALEIADVSTSNGAFPVFAALAAPVNALLNNAWSPVDLERLDVDLDVTPRLEEARVSAVRLERPRVRPGENVRVEVDLASYRGPVETLTLEYLVPKNTPPGTLGLFVGGGAEWARFDATQAPGRYRANSVEELLHRLEDLPRASRLYLAAYSQGRDLSVRGRDYPGLPPSAQLLLSGRDSRDASERWSRSSLLGQTWRSFDWAIVGGTTLAVEVNPRAPSGPERVSSPTDEQGPDESDEPEDR